MQSRVIESRAHPFVREALRVKARKGDRRELLVEGLRLIRMAVASGGKLKRVFHTRTFRSKHGSFMRQLSQTTPEVIETTEPILSLLTDTETPQGVCAVMRFSCRSLQEIHPGEKPLLVVCDGIQDPGNLGTIIRTADAAGADGVMLLPGTCDPLMPKVVRSTAGSIFNLPLAQAEPAEVVRWLRENGLLICGTDASAGKTIFATDLSGPLAFIFGGEARGMGSFMKKETDLFVKIPIRGKAESLNVATSAAVCLYEALRQRS